METNTEIKRGPGRPPSAREEAIDVKSMSPRDVAAAERDRAEARIRSLREGGWRAEDTVSSQDEFYVDPDLSGSDWTYEWKAVKTLGLDLSTHYMALLRQGWEPVPTSRHPEMMPISAKPSDPIERKGLMLMERPRILTDEARRAQERDARLLVRNNEASLGQTSGPDIFERHNKDSSMVKLKKGFERLEIPDE